MFCIPSTDSTPFVYFPALDSSDIFETSSLAKDPFPSMENKRLSSLDHALSEMQARDVAMQQKLDFFLSHLANLTSQQSDNHIPVQPEIPNSLIPPNILKGQGPLPALLSKLNGEHSKGMAFLYSCQTYIYLHPDSFSDDQAKITWALSYMKSGRAVKWAT